MVQKHTGAKILQQDTIDAIDKLLTSQTILINTTNITQLQIERLAAQMKMMNMQLAILTGETLEENETE